MEGTEKGENNEKESPPLRIDPKCFQDALRAFFQPIKTDDPRLDFYTMYRREAMEYDTDYVKKYDEDLNTTLIFAGLFSAVSSAFVIDIHSQLQPDPNEQSAALLRAILLTLNQSAIPGDAPAVPLAQQNPPNEIVTVTSLMYASLLISLLAAFVAMLGKQWLNRYLRNSGGSMIDRCGDRQRKCDGLEKWPLHFFVGSLPVMLQVALFLLACGLCRHMWSINTSVAYTLITLTGSGILFYLAIVIAGTSSYACPFQTPVSIALHGPWKKLRRGIVSFVALCRQAFSWTHRMWNRSVRPFLRRQSPPLIPLENVRVQEPEQWLKPNDLAITRGTNTNDVRCVSWILRNITDPEALDAAVRLAGMVRWFEDGTDVDPPYDLIVTTFHACFDSDGKVYPGSRDKAYYSGRAILWIRTLATCKSEGFADRFPLLATYYTAPASDHDLAHLLTISSFRAMHTRFKYLFSINPGHTPLHSRWISNLLLHHSWAGQTTLNFNWIQHRGCKGGDATIPLDIMLNRLLVWCICLGSSVEEEALKVQDKSDHLKQILHQLSNAIVPAIDTTHPRHRFIPHMIRDLTKLESRPQRLVEMSYRWCSLICENYQGPEDWDNLLLLLLEFGFRHLDPQLSWIDDLYLAHTGHHQGLVDVVFKSNDSEAIADLLQAWTVNTPHRALPNICTKHLVGLHSLMHFSSRLRRLVIRSVELVGYKGFEVVGIERFSEFLNHLYVTVEDADERFRWAELLLDTLQSSEETQHLSHWYWELLVELVISKSRRLRGGDLVYNPRIAISLIEAQEWDKLECWIGTVWIIWPPGTGRTTEEELGHLMLLLSHQRPGAVRKLTEWMGRWSEECSEEVPEPFRRICHQELEAAQQNLP